MPIVVLVFKSFFVPAQENRDTIDSVMHYPGILTEECPQEFRTYINNDSLKSKAVLFVLNESLHPLGRNEFFNDGVKVNWLSMPIRMNRCTMLYIDTGVYRFHTIYQRLKRTVHYETGKIYFARLFSRKQWPLGGISIIKKNENGESVEYAAVLFEYIDMDAAVELYKQMNKKEILVNE